MPPPNPHISADSFLHTIPSPHPTPTPSSPQPPPLTIYFISGNPGLISYYHAFLSLLAKKLATAESGSAPGQGEADREVHIVGHSLAGFELEQTETEKENGKKDQGGEHYFDLEEQIQFVQRRLEGYMRSLHSTSASAPKATPDRDADGNVSPTQKVILIGHSVGSYMAMEILRRHREGQAGSAQNAKEGHMEGEGEGDGGETFDIIGSILLFPTVKDIAMSPSGQKLTFLLRLIPQLALIVSVLARILTTLLSESLLRAVVRSFMRSPPEDAVVSTTRFLRSRKGVRQALHMAADEMRTITTDKWSDDVWGVSTEAGAQSRQQPRLFFYFGRNDHWVAERTRDEIVAARGAKGGSRGPRMIVCEEAVPHAFCLRHNETMASKVATMVREILET